MHGRDSISHSHIYAARKTRTIAFIFICAEIKIIAHLKIIIKSNCVKQASKWASISSAISHCLQLSHFICKQCEHKTSSRQAEEEEKQRHQFSFPSLSHFIQASSCCWWNVKSLDLNLKYSQLASEMSDFEVMDNIKWSRVQREFLFASPVLFFLYFCFSSTFLLFYLHLLTSASYLFIIYRFSLCDNETYRRIMSTITFIYTIFCWCHSLAYSSFGALFILFRLFCFCLLLVQIPFRSLYLWHRLLLPWVNNKYALISFNYHIFLYKLMDVKQITFCVFFSLLFCWLEVLNHLMCS